MRLSIRFGLVLTAAALILAAALPATTAAHGKASKITSYALAGNAVFPEGIAFDARTGNFYVSSTEDGSIQRGNIRKPTASVFIAGSGAQFAAIGLELSRGRLAVAGGTTGEIRVYGQRSGALIRTFTTGAGGFLNDVAATRNGDLYVTDSTRPMLWRVASANITPGASMAAEAWLDFTGTPLVYQSGFNLNGIVVTPDNRFLIVSQTNTGRLFRIDLATKAIVQINLGPELVPGDGLQIRGHTLWAVAGGQIVKVQLSGDWASGTVVSRTSDPSFSSPTTNALARGRMLVVNSQFANRGGTPTLPFTVSSIKIP